MNKIHALSPLLISKIAAGEVIERPSFAVKELLENAIDAKAKTIKIYVEESGLSKIQIIDDGEGMSKEDVLQSWQPHTTSKLHDESQLHTIKSLGFRGEALSSLSSVSKLTIQSRTKNDAIGFQVIIENGAVISSSPVGMSTGTIIIAENLFGSLPARKKFLKSPVTELRHIIDVINQYAIVYPSIHFTFTHGKRTLIDFPATKDLKERVEQLVGFETFGLFLPIKKSESYLSLNGFIAKPQLHSTTQNKQYLFINKRLVSDKIISQAVKEAFGTMLEGTVYPLFVLFLTLPFEMVDVNVHPRKEHVSFVNNEFIFQTVKELVMQLLQENNLTFQNLSWQRIGVGTTKSFAGNVLKKTVLDKEKWIIKKDDDFLQINNLYIVCSTQTGLLVVDQHGAHERILFEKLSSEFSSLQKKSQPFTLKKPIVVKLTPKEQLLLKEKNTFFEQVGFRFISGKITHIPFLFQDKNPLELVKAFLQSDGSAQRESEEMLAFLACRAAVKAGDILSFEQMKKIVTELETTPHNATCPHGRPTKIFIPTDELDNLFKR